MPKQKQDVYATITETITRAIEAGDTVPWRRSWQGGLPRNAKSKRFYKGINVWLLASAPYASPWWLTFKQAKQEGGSVMKGQTGTKIVFWKIVQKKLQNDDGETERASFPVARLYTVFNAEQCEGLRLPGTQPRDNEPLEACDTIVNGYQGKPPVASGRPAYAPSKDTVFMPALSAFESTEEYYSTLFHEFAHSTGHPDRLGRFDTATAPLFGSCDYSKEELVAEFCASFLCGHAGISPAVVANQTAYLAGWLKALQNDPRMLVSAAQAAQKAADHILGDNKEND